MKSGIAGLLLIVGMIAMGVSVKRHYFTESEEVWTESEVEEINQLSFNLHAATVPGAEQDGAKEIRESRLKQLYAKQDKSTNSARLVTNVLWWGGLLSCLAGVGFVALDSKEKKFATLPAGTADAVSENQSPTSSQPKKPTKALGPDSLGPENWR